MRPSSRRIAVIRTSVPPSCAVAMPAPRATAPINSATRSTPHLKIAMAPYLLQAGSVASEPRKPSSAGMAHLALPQRTVRVVLPPALFGA